MAVSKTTRWIIISSVLVLTLASVLWVNKQEETTTAQDELTQPARTNTPAKTQQGSQKSSTSLLQLDKLNRSALETNTDLNDIFKGKSWYVPPPPPKPTKPLPPPPPTAPPLPYTYMGKLIDDGKVSVFLTKQDRNFVIKEGEILEGTYRVERILPPNLTLTYIPLNIKQTMQIGEMN